MFAYSDDGQHFLGYRMNAFGKMQVVYDFDGSKHKVYDVETPDVASSVLVGAIRNAVTQRRVLPALFAALSSQNIHLRESI